MEEQRKLEDIWTPRGCKSHKGKDIKKWINFYSTPGNSTDANRCQIAQNMLRFLSIKDDQWYWCSLRKKNGKYVPNLECIERVREKNAKERRRWSFWDRKTREQYFRSRFAYYG